MVYIHEEDIYYFGGEVIYLDWIDPDCMSLFELDGYLVDIGYMGSMRVMEKYRTIYGWAYFWRLPGERLNEGLHELTSDSAILDMATKIVQETKFVEVYLINKEELRKARLEADEGAPSSNQPAADMEAEHQYEMGNEHHEMGTEYGQETNDVRVEDDLEQASYENYEVSEKDMEVQNSDVENANGAIYIDSSFDVNIDDEFYDSDNPGSVHSDEEECVPTRARYPQFNPEK
ncbi:unnamed protein product [Linum tenue]|uniref:PB1-like domain-containing protein n=1 Tax=Linum tenue TaxID=586396 RepID=A0AAV0KRT2_9ROSI|nr:unnamed protein product [Linum tenue]